MGQSQSFAHMSRVFGGSENTNGNCVGSFVDCYDSNINLVIIVTEHAVETYNASTSDRCQRLALEDPVSCCEYYQNVEFLHSNFNIIVLCTQSGAVHMLEVQTLTTIKEIKSSKITEAPITDLTGNENSVELVSQNLTQIIDYPTQISSSQSNFVFMTPSGALTFYNAKIDEYFSQEMPNCALTAVCLYKRNFLVVFDAKACLLNFYKITWGGRSHSGLTHIRQIPYSDDAIRNIYWNFGSNSGFFYSSTSTSTIVINKDLDLITYPISILSAHSGFFVSDVDGESMQVRKITQVSDYDYSISDICKVSLLTESSQVTSVRIQSLEVHGEVIVFLMMGDQMGSVKIQPISSP